MKERSRVIRPIARALLERLRRAAVTSAIGLALAFSPAANTADRLPPLKGGVEKSDRDRQGEGYCARYADSYDPFEGTLEVMPKGGRAPGYCQAPRPNWTLLGEEGNYCCFFAPRDWIPKVPLLPGNVQKDEPTPDRRPTPNDPKEYPKPPQGDNKRLAACVKAPYDVRNDVPDADPSLRYTLGFERGFAGCLEKNVKFLAVAALASHYKRIAVALLVVSVPGVIDGVLHPPGISANPNPFLRGKDEGERLCEWGLQVSPVLVARCPPGAGSPRSRICSVKEIMSGYGNAAAAANANGGKRFDCFPCTMAWLKGKPYTPPVDGGTPVPLAEISALFKRDYGSLVPQGPELPCWRQAAQTKGIPGSMTPAGIIKEMKLAGDGAKGVITTLDPLTGEVGHVFGAKTIGSGRNAKVQLWDEQQQMDGDLWFTSGTWEGKWIAFYRIQ